MAWVRGDTIGCGSFGTVNLLVPGKGFPESPLMAVKSCDTINSVSLKNEKEVLDRLGFCPQVIRCFGDDYSFENGDELYNLFLEYANNGSLADHVKRIGGSLMESDVRRYVRSILKGLSFVHAKGFAHCDIKLQNILMFGNGDVKIADFGLAKRKGEGEEEQRRVEIRGTPLNMAPESVNGNDYDSQVDIWALGCAIVEMFTGKPAWNFKAETMNVASLLIRIGASDELPGIPQDLSEEGKDFLGKCFVKDPKKRWTAEMLLDHPFMAGITEEEEEEEEESTSPNCNFEEFSESPRCHFDFPDWVSTQSTVSFSSQSIFQENSRIKHSFTSQNSSPLDRIRQLGCDESPDWSVSEDWFNVRGV